MKRILIIIAALLVTSVSQSYAFPPTPPSSPGIKADGSIPFTGAPVPSGSGTVDLGSSSYPWKTGYFTSIVMSAADGSRSMIFSNNTSYTPGAGENSLYFEGNVGKISQNGVESTVATTTGPLNFDDVNGSATGDLSAANVSRTLINSYGRSGAVTLTLPAAAEGMTFIALVGTQHNSAWKIQRNGSDTITWSANGTDTPGKTYFQETNQAVGSRVSCITYRSGASAYTWLCGATTGTWVTD